MTPRSAARNRRDGFTLVEIVFAMAVLALGVLSAVGLMRWVVQGTDFNTSHSTATFLAQEKLEDLMYLGYAGAQGGSDTTQNMTRTWSVAGSNPKTLTVSVAWKSLGGASQGVSMQSMVAEP